MAKRKKALPLSREAQRSLAKFTTGLTGRKKDREEKRILTEALREYREKYAPEEYLERTIFVDRQGRDIGVTITRW